MGFMDMLSPMLTNASTAYSAYQQGAEKGRAREKADVLEMIKMRHQQQQDANTQAMQAVQQRNLESEMAQRTFNQGQATKKQEQADAQELSEQEAARQELATAYPTNPLYQKPNVAGQPQVNFKVPLQVHRTKIDKDNTLKETRASIYAAGHDAYPKDPVFSKPMDPDYPYEQYAPILKSREGQSEAYRRAALGGYSFPSSVVDANGNPVRVNSKSGGVTSMPDLKLAKPPGGAGGAAGGGQSQMFGARLLGAMSEGSSAIGRMDKFEDTRFKGGRMNVGVIPDITGKVTIGLDHSKSVGGILAQAISERTSNVLDPDYLQYMRDARLVSRAEQLMASRGGSEAQASDNAMLARAGANAPAQTIIAARKSRRALFGKMGAIMQVLSPEQKEKLLAGLEALKADDESFDYAKTGQEIFGGAQSPASPPQGGGGSAVQLEQRVNDAITKTQGGGATETPAQRADRLIREARGTP